MRFLRILVTVVALSSVAVACGDDTTATTTQPGATTTTQPGGALSTTLPGGGGGANGSIVFSISGGYQASGEFSFIPLASAFANGGWSASFANLADNNAILVLNTIEGSVGASYGDGQAAIAVAASDGCDFNITKNDASGLAGTFACHGVTGFTTAGAVVTVDFSGQFDAHT